MITCNCPKESRQLCILNWSTTNKLFDLQPCPFLPVTTRLVRRPPHSLSNSVHLLNGLGEKKIMAKLTFQKMFFCKFCTEHTYLKTDPNRNQNGPYSSKCLICALTSVQTCRPYIFHIHRTALRRMQPVSDNHATFVGVF